LTITCAVPYTPLFRSDAEALGAMDPEVAGEHAAVRFGADRAGARRVMAPRVVADEAFEIGVARRAVAGQFLLRDQIRFHPGRHPDRKSTRLNSSHQII